MSLRGTKHVWSYEPADPGLASAIREAAGTSRVYSEVLVSRGVANVAQARGYIESDLETLPDARLLPDSDRVVARVGDALAKDETIAVHGHDDADGVTATTIMVEALAQLGASTVTYIPDRRTEGHGLSRAEFDRLDECGVRLVVTVDSCVSDRDAIGYGNGLGIDTIVTDHHEIPPELPPAVAVVDPKLPGTDFPYRYMAGVGVSFRVADLLLGDLSGRFGPARDERSWYGATWRDDALGLVAIGSIADKVPLTFDNRTLVTLGLEAIPRTERPGLRALLEESRLWGVALDENNVRESLGPAFGRVSDGRGGNGALDLLLETGIEDARARARALIGVRAKWRRDASAAWRNVRGAVAAKPAPSEAQIVIVVVHEPIAVLGYITSRLFDETRLPVIVLADKGSEWMAEARGPNGFNFVQGFNSMRELFLGYGGHPRAAGFTIDEAKIPIFRERMLEYVRANPPTPPPRLIDAELPLVDATPEIARELSTLRPFGQSNPPAILLGRATTVDEYESARAKGLRFGTPVRVGREPVDLVYRLRYNDGIAFASVLDTIARPDSGGTPSGAGN